MSSPLSLICLVQIGKVQNFYRVCLASALVPTVLIVPENFHYNKSRLQAAHSRWSVEDRVASCSVCTQDLSSHLFSFFSRMKCVES